MEDFILKDEKRRLNFNLNRMRNAIKHMGEPCRNIPAIQIVGTNGKGSITSFLKSCLLETGVNTGITTSPHLINWQERICVNGIQISRSDFHNGLVKLKSTINKYQLTPFESVIALALNYFHHKNVKLLILEAGLGGRLDATTAHSNRPIIGFGGIGMDHCEYLGNNLVSIAKEKASVITTNSHVISAPQHPEVEKVLKEIVERKKAFLRFVKPLSEEWSLGIPGEVQKQNAAVAKGILESLINLGWEINQESIFKGFSKAKWPGRLQAVHWNHLPFLIDCAHNPHAAKHLAIEREKWNNNENGVSWILGIQKQKDAIGIVETLIKKNDIALIIPVPGCESWNNEEISRECPNLSERLIKVDNIDEAFYLAHKETKKNFSPTPVITGSIYLIGDLLRREILKY